MLVTTSEALDLQPLSVPLLVEFLGERSFAVVPSTFTFANFVAWHGIHDYAGLVDSEGNAICPQDEVRAWVTVCVRLNQDDLDFELKLRLDGFGPAQNQPQGLRVSETWINTGLWFLDQWTKNHALVSWTGLGFAPLTIWLPSFSDAVIEKWPCFVDQHIKAWFVSDRVLLFAIVRESWGWSLVRFEADSQTFWVTFFHDVPRVLLDASRLAARTFEASGRSQYVELRAPTGLLRQDSSLAHVFMQIDLCNGMPVPLALALRDSRDLTDSWMTKSQEEVCVSPTVPFSFTDPQLPVLAQSKITTDRRVGLNAKFMLTFARALLAQTPSTFTQEQIKVICLDADWEELHDCICDSFSPGLVLCQKHWTFVRCVVEGETLVVTHFDGLALTSLASLSGLVGVLKAAWNTQHVNLGSTCLFSQRHADTCGTVALAHFAHCLDLITFEQASNFESWHGSFAICSALFKSRNVGFGAEDQAIVAALEQILPAKGVPSDEVRNRANAALKLFGAAAIGRALDEKNVWAALKSLGSSRPRPFMWVQHQELQKHIQAQSQNKFGHGINIKKPKKLRDQKRSKVDADHIDPANLALPSGLFITNDRQEVNQISLDQVLKDARGVAFAKEADVQQFLNAGKFISQEGLNILVLGGLSTTDSHELPMHALSVPAVYRGTNEPVIVDCVSLQLGDQAIYRAKNNEQPELTVLPTVVFRAHIYKDQWGSEGWPEFTLRPIKSLVQSFQTLQICNDRHCDGCPCYHPSIEETGAESALTDIWGFKWSDVEGNKTTPEKSELLSIYFRTPESNFQAVHVSSGNKGVFFEPRSSTGPGPDERFAVVWDNKMTFQDAAHRVKTDDICLAVCRLGHKIGIRCLVKEQENLHSSICPEKPFVPGQVKLIYRLQPLPVGTQRQSIIDMLKSVGWVAKPLQPCRGSQGQAWTVGAEQPPANLFIEAKHGWVSISKVKDQAPAVKPQAWIASARTRQHIQRVQAGSTSAGSQGPWVTGEDRWKDWKGPKGTVVKAAPPSQHVQSKIDDVEQRLQDHVEAKIAKEVGLLQDKVPNSRLDIVENHIQSLAAHQQKLEKWISDGNQQMQTVHQECTHMKTVVNEQAQHLGSVKNDVAQVVEQVAHQGQALQKVASDVSNFSSGLTNHLDRYFAQQEEKIEAMLAKRSRT